MSKPDLSVLKPPIHLGISGVRHIMECMETGTEEVKSALTEECDVLFECKVCKSMFRALPNYLAHKRVYCLESHQDTRLAFVQIQQEEYTMIVQPQAPVDEPPVNTQEQETEKSAEVSAEQSAASKSAASDFYEKTIERLQVKESSKKEAEIELQPVEGNSNAVKQAVKNKNEHRAEVKQEKKAEKRNAETEEEVEPKKKRAEGQSSQGKKSKMDLRANPKRKVSPDKVVSTTYKERLEDIPGCSIETLKCLLCNSGLSSHKSLYNHMVNLHSSTRTYFPCPYCKQPFTKLYSVTAHLEKQHKKSKQQIERMRERLRRMAFKKIVNRAKNSVVIHDEEEEPEVIEVNDSPGEEEQEVASNMKPVVSLSPCIGTHQCEPCGRSFVKKDSLTRHLPFCMHRRKAITNELDPVKKDDEAAESPKGPFAEIDLFRGFTAEMLKRVESLIDQEQKLCKKCETDFDSDLDLHRHVVKHLGLKRFKCKLCKYTCHNRSGCKYHLQSCHASSVVGFTLLQFRVYIIDLHPDKPLPRLDMSPFASVKKDAITDADVTKGQSKRTLAFKSPKKSAGCAASKVLEKDPMEDTDEEEDKEEKKKGKSKDEPKKKVTKKGKAAEEETEMLQVLSTRSGVKYKKPSLEEILQTKEKDGSGEEGSSEEEEKTEQPPPVVEKQPSVVKKDSKNTSQDAKKEVVKRRESSRERRAPRHISPELKTKVRRDASSENKSNVARDFAKKKLKKLNSLKNAPVKVSFSQGQKKESHKPRVPREKPRSTPPRILRDPKSTPVTTTVLRVSLGPKTPLTASDLLKQNRRKSPARKSPSAQKVSQSPPSPSLKTFDLSKAKVILSPLMTPGTPSEQLKISQSLLADPNAIIAGDSTLPRIAPKPATKDIVVLVETPSGVNNVLDAVDQAAMQQTPVCTNVMYVLKDNTLTPVTHPQTGMTLVTIGGNPDVAGSCKVISVVPVPTPQDAQDAQGSGK